MNNSHENIDLNYISIPLSNGNYIFSGDIYYGREYDVTDEMILGVMSAVIRNGKNLSISDWRYKAYYHIWCDCYPVPVFIMHLVLKVRRVSVG